MQDILKIIFEWKICFNFLSKFSYYKKHSASWFRKCKAVWCKALAIVIRLQWNINIQVSFSKNPQTFRDMLFIAEGQTERGMGMMSITVVFLNFVTSLQTRQGSPDSLIGMCRMGRFFAARRSFFHSSLLYTLSFHTIPRTRFPSSLISSSYLFLGLPINLVVPKFIYNTLLEILFSSIHCKYTKKHNLLNLLSLLQ